MVNNLCERVLLLQDGQIAFSGDTTEGISRYTTQSEGLRSWTIASNALDKRNWSMAGITDITLLDLDGVPLRTIFTGDGMVIRLSYEVEAERMLPIVSFVVRMYSQFGQEVYRFSTTPISGFPVTNLSGTGHVDLHLPKLPLTEGQYVLDVGIARKAQGFYHELKDIIRFDVSGKDVYGNGRILTQSNGISVLPHQWTLHPQHEHHRDSALIGRDLYELPLGASYEK